MYGTTCSGDRPPPRPPRPPPPPLAPPPPTCSPFGASTQIPADCTVSLCGGQTITFGVCGLVGAACSGDTWLELYTPEGERLVYNDDYCGVCSKVNGYTVPVSYGSWPQPFYIHQTCYANSTSCSGTTAYTIAGPPCNAAPSPPPPSPPPPPEPPTPPAPPAAPTYPPIPASAPRWCASNLFDATFDPATASPSDPSLTGTTQLLTTPEGEPYAMLTTNNNKLTRGSIEFATRWSVSTNCRTNDLSLQAGVAMFGSASTGKQQQFAQGVGINLVSTAGAQVSGSTVYTPIPGLNGANDASDPWKIGGLAARDSLSIVVIENKDSVSVGYSVFGVSAAGALTRLANTTAPFQTLRTATSLTLRVVLTPPSRGSMLSLFAYETLVLGPVAVGRFLPRQWYLSVTGTTTSFMCVAR